MGMEIPVSDISMTPEIEKETIIPEKETIAVVTPNESDPIASVPEKEIPKIEEADQANANLPPKNASDQWDQPEKIQKFYIPKVRPLDDPKIKTKIDQMNKVMNNNKELKGKLFKDLSAKNKERSEIMEVLLPLRDKLRKLNETINQKKTEMAPVKEGLAKIRTDNFAIKEKGFGLCSSVEDLDMLLRSLEYRMSHESMSLDQEKKLMKEIKQLEGTRARVISNSSERSKFNTGSKKESLEDQKKSIGADMDEMKKERDEIWAQIKPLEEQKTPIEEAIKALEAEKNAITERNNKAYNTLKEVYAERDALNKCFTENRQLLVHAKNLAAQKNVSALEALTGSETEKFMSEWTTKKAFHEDYEKRILTSLDFRQLSRDGRIRNPNEKPIVQPITHKPAVPEPAPISEPAPVSKPTPLKNEKATTKPVVVVVVAKAEKEEEEEEYYGKGKKLEGESVKKDREIDVKKLKEMKREEEIAKNKIALERKKKLAEKNAAKAAAKAQKEAEEKLKKKEAKKAAKKKVDGSDEANEPEAKSDESVELESELKEETESIPPRTKSKQRGGKKGQSNTAAQLPKVVLKRKKPSQNYMAWAPLGVAVLVALLVGGFAVYYKFYLNKEVEA